MGHGHSQISFLSRYTIVNVVVVVVVVVVVYCLLTPTSLIFIIHHLFVTLLAELYHQYHDGFMLGEQYPESYNALAKKAFAQGRLQKTGCPDTNF